jgi:hypothetical protein
MNYVRISCILITVTVVVGATGCSKATADDCKNSYQAKRVEEIARQADQRMLDAMHAGIEETKRRMIAAKLTIDEAIAKGYVPAEKDIPTSVRLPDGTMHPFMKEYAIDGDGQLRGEGPSMKELGMEMKFATDALARAKENGCE